MSKFFYGVKSFQEKVYFLVKKIPKGQTLSYKQVAEKIGCPKAWRAVGNTLNKNIDPKIPCHRVICSNGKVGGYRKGKENKIKILKKEGVFFKTKVLTQKFFNQPTLKVAKNLLGKFLVCQYRRKEIILMTPHLQASEGLMITEVEAYDGPNDKASHASRGKTKRNKIMFGPPGYWYIYFTYGMHWMLNIVTGPENYPAAVLIRGTKQIKGPARITKHLKINKRFNGLLANKKTGLWIEDREVKIKSDQIISGKRIGVEYAGKWAGKPYRFKLEF